MLLGPRRAGSFRLMASILCLLPRGECCQGGRWMMSWACLAVGRFVCAISERRHRAVGAIRRWFAAAASRDAVAFLLTVAGLPFGPASVSVPAQAYRAVRRRLTMFFFAGATKVTLPFPGLMA